MREVHVFRLTCADKDNSVLAERIILKRENARDMFTEGIFQSKVTECGPWQPCFHDRWLDACVKASLYA